MTDPVRLDIQTNCHQINVKPYIDARASEILELRNLLSERRNPKTLLQRLPRGLRRRQGSHYPRRFPRAWRTEAKFQLSRNLSDAKKETILKSRQKKEAKSRRCLRRNWKDD